MEIINGEVVYILIFDVGKSIDLTNIVSVFPEIRYKKVKGLKDTPSNIDFLEPFIIQITHPGIIKSTLLTNLTIKANLYEDGVISLIGRVSFKDIQLEELHTLRNVIYEIENKKLKIYQLLKYHFNLIQNKITPYINKGLYSSEKLLNEKYTCFCISEGFENPIEILQSNQHYLAALLMGENPNLTAYCPLT